jgi:hypothetical protein
LMTPTNCTFSLIREVIEFLRELSLVDGGNRRL